MEESGKEFVDVLTEAIWYLDGHEDTLKSRVCHVPAELLQFFGHNQPQKSKHRKKDISNLTSDVLDTHSCNLNRFLLYPWMNSAVWKTIKPTISELTSSLSKYAKYLKAKNAEPVRPDKATDSFHVIKEASWVKPTFVARYGSLESHLVSLPDFTPVFVNDFAPANARSGFIFYINWCT